MAAPEQVQNIVKNMLLYEYVHVDQPLKPTGRYALKASAGSGMQTEAAIRANLLIEVKSLDPDIRQTSWVKLTDLHQIGSVV